MNKVILIGRLTRDPDIRYSQEENAIAIARYTLAVNRKYNKNSDQSVDYIPCIAFGKSAEFAEKWLKKGIKICLTGRIQTGSYTNKEGVKVYTTEIIVEDQEFAESKNSTQNHDFSDNSRPTPSATSGDGFMSIPEGIEDELPFQ